MCICGYCTCYARSGCHSSRDINQQSLSEDFNTRGVGNAAQRRCWSSRNEIASCVWEQWPESNSSRTRNTSITAIKRYCGWISKSHSHSQQRFHLFSPQSARCCPCSSSGNIVHGSSSYLRYSPRSSREFQRDRAGLGW